MSAKLVVPHVYMIPLGFVNVFLLEDDQGLTLIDSGLPHNESKILNAVRELGQDPADIHRILITHLHADHTGSLAALKAVLQAEVYAHSLDASAVRQGVSARPLKPAPGLFNAIVVRLAMALQKPTILEPTAVEHEIKDGDVLDGGLTAIHVPGHAAGQVALLWDQHGGVLFAADAATNTFGLGQPPVYEDQDAGQQSLRKLAALDFEVACFGHGKPITEGASQRFRQKWG